MTTTILRRAGLLTSVAVALTFGLSACGSSDDSSNDKSAGSEPTTSSSSDAMDASDGTFGPGCKLIPASGAGSFNGMATAPVATAASANPLLKTLVTAVTKAGLVDTLNSADALTVFAPTDDAFGKIPSADLNKILADKATLTKILTHHVVAGQLSPDQLAGTHKTLAGDTIKVTGSGTDFKVAGANVLCGGIKTANATVYVIDTVLTPAS